MPEESAKLRATFDEAALLYDEVRPGYPEELFDDVVSITGLRCPSRAAATG
jgi:hypothetical protein